MSVVALVCAALLAACVAARFPPWHAALSGSAAAHAAVVDAVVFAVAGAALFVAVAAEARTKRGTVGPLWMQVKAAPRLALAIALSFCTTTMAQILDVDFGPVDVNFPAGAPAIQTLWFFAFTLGFSGIGMMSAPSVFLPVLHPPARLLRRTPFVVAAGVFGVVGAGVGVAFARLLVFPPIVAFVSRSQSFLDDHPQQVFAVTLALTIGPVLFPFGKGDPDDDADGDADADDDA